MQTLQQHDHEQQPLNEPRTPNVEVTNLESTDLELTNHTQNLAVAQVTRFVSVAVAAAHPQPSELSVSTAPAPALAHRPHRRRGRVAVLSKIHRDMVNRMIENGVPYKNIVAALQYADIIGINERNISNWATGGYLEWKFQQDLVCQNRLDQDGLLDHLRREDASELSEVGLQAAATRLSQILVQKTASADDVERNLGSFSQMVDVLCRLNREIGTMQKQRDDASRTLGRSHDPVRIKDFQQNACERREWEYTSPEFPEESGLEVPAEPPMLPLPSPARDLELSDRKEESRKKQERYDATMQTLKAFSSNKQPAEPASTPASS